MHIFSSIHCKFQRVESTSPKVLSPSQRRGAPFREFRRSGSFAVPGVSPFREFPRLFTPGEREALAMSKVHQ
jgi:hypothetical protein